MGLFELEVDVQRGLSLASRVHAKYRPVFEKLGDRAQAALAYYFLPHQSKKDVLEVTRPRVIKWYCPFADQRSFPSGHRYCINVYTGCAQSPTGGEKGLLPIYIAPAGMRVDCPAAGIS